MGGHPIVLVPVVVPQLHGPVVFAARNKRRLPVAHRETAHAAVVQGHAERLDRDLLDKEQTNGRSIFWSSLLLGTWERAK